MSTEALPTSTAAIPWRFTERVRVCRGDGRVVIEGGTPPPAWVGPSAVGVALFGGIAWAIATGLCFDCAAYGVDLWPFAMAPLLLAFLRGFRITASGERVVVERTFAGAVTGRWSAPSARVMRLPQRAGARFAAAIILEGSREETLLVGHVRAAAWIAALEDTIAARP
jgi:hypothetical protein